MGITPNGFVRCVVLVTGGEQEYEMLSNLPGFLLLLVESKHMYTTNRHRIFHLQTLSRSARFRCEQTRKFTEH
jgi:hypothetical protein